jgi:hypothetical protein
MKCCGLCRLFTFPVITESPDISYDRTTTHWRHNDHPQHYGKIHWFDCSYWLRSNAILPDSIIGRVGIIFSPCRPAAPARKTPPPSSPGRTKRRWRVVLLRSKGEILGTVEAPDVASAKAAAAVQFGLDEVQRNRIMVQELA